MNTSDLLLHIRGACTAPSDIMPREAAAMTALSTLAIFLGGEAKKARAPQKREIVDTIRALEGLNRRPLFHERHNV